MTGDNQNGGSLPSTRIGYETSSEWLKIYYYEISNSRKIWKGYENKNGEKILKLIKYYIILKKKILSLFYL